MLPHEVCNEAVRVNQFSLMGRPLMRRKQNIRAVVNSLPRIWGLSGLVNGRLIDRTRFQFVFPSEEMMRSVINRGPWAYNERMLVIKRWTPEMTEESLDSIPFWIQIRGIPIQYLTAPVIQHIGDRLGGAIEVDFNPETATAIEFVRVKVLWNVNSPLRLKKNFQFAPGANTLLRLRYERLKGFCETCGMLTHDTGECVQQQQPQQMEEGGEGDDNDGDEAGNNHPQEQVDPEGHGNDAGDEVLPEMKDSEEGEHGDPDEGYRAQAIQVGSPHAISDSSWNSHVLRHNKFVENLLDDCINGETEVAEEGGLLNGKTSMEAEPEPMTPEMDGQWPFMQYGSFLESGSQSGESSRKRQRDDANCVDKYPVVLQKMSKVEASHGNSLRKLQLDYGDMENDFNNIIRPSLSRGAVGPNPSNPP